MSTLYLKKLTHDYKDHLNQIVADPSKHQFPSVQYEICYLRRAQVSLTDEVVCLLKYIDRHDLLSDYVSNWHELRKMAY